MADLLHEYFEENNLHAFLIEQIKDFDDCIKELDRFLPYVDNWATCDSMRPKCLKNNLKRLEPIIDKWLVSSHTYTVRFAIQLLMLYFLDESFNESHLAKVAAIKSDEYYVNMMIAWYFATALAMHYDAVIPYFKTKILDKWTHNKAIQKALESYRITPEQKQELKHFKIK